MKNLAFPTYSIKGKPVEYKTFRFEVKSVDESEGTITGYLSTFGNVDLGNDRVLPGAFKKTIAEAYSRKKTGRKFLMPLLWMHDPEQPIGGFTDASEDAQGLLCTAQLDISVNSAGIPNNPIATRIFSGFKMGYIDELSIGYIAIQKSYDKQGIRDLKECALIEGSSVTMNFAMNPDALVPASGVKAMQTKGASGKTSWPLADRATKWDAGQATKDIEAWANGDWNKVAQCFFWIAESPPTKLDDCKLPFVANVGGKMQAIPQGVISCAGVLQGAMGGVDIPSDDMDTVKTKVASYYKKMDMTPPWEDSGKRRRMSMQQKDFDTLFAVAQQADCLEDWADLLNTFTQTMIQIHGMGDSPVPDMEAALAQFGAEVQKWNAKAIESNLGDYLNSQGYCNGTPYVPYNLQAGYMTRHDKLDAKSGATFSAASKEALQAKAQEIQDAIAEHKSMVSDHLDTMQQKVSDLTQVWASEGQGPAYGNDKSRDMRREPLPALPRTGAKSNQQPLSSTVDAAIDEIAALLM